MKLISKSAKQSLQLCLLTVLLIILAFPAKGMAQTVFSGGTGEEGNPYLIATEAELEKIAEGLDKHYKLTEDIVLTGTWTPIGVFTMTSPAFTGTIDGDGHTISNLKIDNDKNGGFVSHNNGTIKNLGLNLGENGIKSTMAIGGIAAENGETGRIQHCYVNGHSISSKLTSASSYAGGVCGINKGMIENCFVQVETIEINNSSEYLHDAGGIAGYQNGGMIKHCISFVGAIKHLNAQGNPSPGRLDYIVGSQYGECTSIGNYGSYKTKITYPDRYDATATGDKGNLWLGVLDSDHAAWSYSENTLELKTTEGSKSFFFNNLDAHIYLEGEGTTENPFKISNATDLRKLSEYTNNGFYSETSCYVLTADIDLNNVPFTPIASEYCISRGDIKQFQPFKGHFDGQGHSIENLTVNSSSGLFALIQNATIKNVALIDCQINSFAYNNSSYKEPNYSERTSVGTLVGADNGYSAVEGKSLISNCYATGTIRVSILKEKGISVGGIIGQLKLNSEVTSCFSDVAITVNKPAEGGTSDVAVGGIVGLLGGIVQNCFAKGNITSTANTLKNYNGAYVGSIVGLLDHNSWGNSWGKLNSCIALSTNIESTSESKNGKNMVSRIGTRNADKKEIALLTYANYGRQKVNLKLNGTPFSFVEDLTEYDAIVGNNPVCHFAEDGTDWKGERPSADAWEKTDGGYVNLKSIATTFQLTQQIKLSDYVPFAITLSETIANGTLTPVPTEAYSGDKVTITVAPDPGYQLKENSLKHNDTPIVGVDDVYSFIMPSEAVTLSASFVPDTLRLNDISIGNSLLISQEADLSWWYEVKTTEAATKALRSTNGKTPFNGIITGKLANDKALVMSATCQSEITFDGVTVSTFIIEQGAAVVLGSASKLTYTTAKNNGGSLVAKSGATITDGTAGTIKTSAVTFTAPTNGTFTVQVGTTLLASGDQVTEGSKFTVTATPAPGYETASVQVMQGTVKLTATDGVYTMPGEGITISVTFTKSDVTPPVIPPVTPPVTPVYHTVTLPVLIGAVTNPAAGRHEVERWNNFLFVLTLDADYSQSIPLVKANGTVVAPRPSDGKYVINAVREDQTITIDGIVKNTPPVGNAEIETDNRIYTANSVLYIQVAQPTEAQIVTFGGNVLRSLSLPAGQTTISDLIQGLYIVRLGNGTSQKVKL